jgi:hypothetical protein
MAERDMAPISPVRLSQIYVFFFGAKKTTEFSNLPECYSFLLKIGHQRIEKPADAENRATGK